MPPKPTAGSAAKAATALKLNAKAATASKAIHPGRSLDDELAAAWMVAPTQGEETWVLGFFSNPNPNPNPIMTLSLCIIVYHCRSTDIQLSL